MAGNEDGKIAPRYARALFELLPQEHLDEVEGLLIELAAAWKDSIELRNVLLNPGISLKERADVLRELVASSRSAETVGNFLALLLENGRVGALAEIQRAFSSELAAFKSLLALQITSAFPVSEEEKQSTLERLKNECGSLVSVDWKEDKDLIGGLLIKSGDRVLDNTIRGSIEKIRHSLAK